MGEGRTMQEQLSRATQGAVAYRDVGKGREQERKLCRGKRDSIYANDSHSGKQLIPFVE
jgi:hypothetical protein